MTFAAALLGYVGVTLAVGPTLLRRLSADGAAPRLAIAAWLTAITSVMGSAVAATALLVVEMVGHWGDPGNALAWSAGTVAIAVLLGALVRACVRIAATLRRMRRQTFAHADAIRVVGRQAPGGVVVVDADEPAAYCVAGRPPAIVVTTAVLAALDDDQLAAVLAHERAHLDGRHAHVVAGVRSLAALFPHVALFTSGATQISALLEMCADDVAVRRHGRRPLLAGLLALTGANPAHALAAAGVAVLARAQRLSSQRSAYTRLRTCAALTGAVAVMTSLPLTVGALAVCGVLLCFA